jgi:chorismate mutase/prephenate dehydratase
MGTSHSIGTLGSVLTFAGQAAEALRSQRVGRYADDTAYFPTMEAVAEAALTGVVDVGVLTSETSRTACTDTAARILAGEQLFVVDEILVPYHCALLVRPGTVLADIRHVGGHGSLRQCRRYLAKHLPAAQVEMHEHNSVVAGREVMAGDGATAVVGTLALAAELGLEVLARDVDDDAVGGWWALASEPQWHDGADHVALRVEGADELESALSRAAQAGLRLRTVTNAPTGTLFHYRYLVTLRSERGPVAPVVLDSFGSALVGAFTTSTAN